MASVGTRIRKPRLDRAVGKFLAGKVSMVKQRS
jgi:hypothetical protein